MLVIPNAPERLVLGLDHHWNGTRCPDSLRRGELSLALAGDVLEIGASFRHQLPPRLPEAPPGSRVANLWEFPVAFGVSAVPETWIIDPSGVVQLRLISKVTAEQLDTILQQYREQYTG